MNSGAATAMSRQLINFRYGLAIAASRCSGRTPVPEGAISAAVHFLKERGEHQGHRCSSTSVASVPVSFNFWRSTAGFHTLSSVCSGYKVPDSSLTTADVETSYRRVDNPVSQKLMSARTTEEIISVLEAEAEMMDVITVSVAVDALFDALRNETGLTVKMKHQLLTSVGVQKLCKLLRRFGPRMDPGDLINGVKLLSILSAPGNHQTLQVILKLMSKHANNMHLQQLAYMQFLLDKMDPESKSSLSKALEFALPVVFESQLSTQLDRNDPFAVCDYLHYATRWKLSEKSINLLVDAALRLTDRIPPKNVMSLMWSLGDCDFTNPAHEPLVSWGFRKITESMDNYKLSELTSLMDRSARKFIKRVHYFYNEDFVNAFCQKYTSKDMNQLDTLWVMKNMSVFRHVNIDLVDRVGEIIASNPALILNNDFLFVILMRAFSNFNYKPEKWSSFVSILLEHPSMSMSTKHFGITEVLLAIDFLSLDLFPENLIRILYSADGLPVLEEVQSRAHPVKLLLIYNAVKLLYPEYRGPLPPISMIENWKELARASNANKQYPLKAALQTGLGGESYVINGLYHDGIHVDHGIVMRKGGYPVAVNSQSDSQTDCLSSIAKPVDGVMILIKAINKDLYATNTRRLRGSAQLEQKIIESLGHPVVAVDSEKWMELPDHEKIPFLMQRIREKMEHLQWNQNWGDVIPP